MKLRLENIDVLSSPIAKDTPLRKGGDDQDKIGGFMGATIMSRKTSAGGATPTAAGTADVGSITDSTGK